MLTLVLSVVDSTVLVGDEFLGSLHSEVDCVGKDFLLLNLTYLSVSITTQVTRFIVEGMVFTNIVHFVQKAWIKCFS